MTIVRRWLAICAGWALFALFNGSQIIVTSPPQAKLNYQQIYGVSFMDALAWAILTPGILRLSAWRMRWQLLIAFHLVAGIIVTVIHIWITAQLVTYVGYRTPPNRTIFAVFLQARLRVDIFSYWLLVGIITAWTYYRQARERELSLTEARLQLLHAQLQPHFLFNALNTISSLMYKDVPAADRVLNRLAGFLRLSLDTAKTQEVSLATELEYTDRYLDIERVRFMDRLTVERQIEAEVLEAMVPTLILQPLVENALKHGVGTRAGGGILWIRAGRRNGMLAVEVEDEGWPPQEVQEGVGLTNARARLATLYGERQRLWIDQGASGGFRVSMELPYRT